MYGAGGIVAPFWFAGAIAVLMLSGEVIAGSLLCLIRRWNRDRDHPDFPGIDLDCRKTGAE